MKKIIKNYALSASLALIPFLLAAPLSANQGYTEGTWELSFRGGVVPAKFDKNVSLTTTFVEAGFPVPADQRNDITTDTAIQRTSTFSYMKLYSLPYDIGVDVGFFPMDDFEMFVNFDFVHGCSKAVKYTTIVDDGDSDNIVNNTATSSWKVRDLNSVAAYLGARRFFFPASSVMPFIGAKLGVKGHGSCSGSESHLITFQDGVTPAIRFDRASGKSCTYVSGGLQLGFDWIYEDAYAMTVMSEVIMTQGHVFKPGRQLHPASPKGQVYTNITRNNKNVLSFPLTLGFRVRL